MKSVQFLPLAEIAKPALVDSAALASGIEAAECDVVVSGLNYATNAVAQAALYINGSDSQYVLSFWLGYSQKIQKVLDAYNADLRITEWA